MSEPIFKPDSEPAERRERNVVGKPFRRVDGRAKVTGATRFADDLAFPRMVFLKLVRSTVPHGRIARIDVVRNPEKLRRVGPYQAAGA